MTGNELRLPSFAKINWWLRVLGRRSDGFHELCTTFQTVSLFDEIYFGESRELVLTCSEPSIPTGESNLILKAAKILQSEFRIESGARIHLEKRIPAPGGLGGGSSNAAIALLGLAKLWRLEISGEAFRGFGARLGSDVPFFFYGGTAYGAGRGTEIAPITEIEEKYLLVVTPAAQIPTSEAFARLDAPHLTKFSPKSILKICQTEAESFRLGQTAQVNDFERSVFEFEPEIKRVKETLLRLGARQAALSGSGASVYAVFDKEETRQATIKALDLESTWRKFAVATVSRDEYREALKMCEGLLPISF